MLSKSYLLLVLSLPFLCHATSAQEVQSNMDILWVVIAGALVFFMQAGFALLESGMSRAKNSVNVIMKNYADLSIGSLAFCLLGFGFMFGTNSTGFIGTDSFLLNGVEGASDYAFVFFQIMFAATAVTICAGAMAERTKFIGYLIAAIFICGFIYPIFGSWVWGGYVAGSGWLAKLGFIDFAGSTVVHSIGGWCALAGVIVVKPRLGRFSSTGEIRDIPGHNLNYMALGGFILWLGWFGFNAGSTLEASSDIGLIALNTHLSAVAGAIAVVIYSLVFKKPILAKTTINGGIAGLVGITAGCASMSPMFAIITGFIAGFVMMSAEKLLESLRIDDAVGAIAVHAFAGAWGTLAAGLFLKGNLFDPDIIAVQLTGIVIAFIWAFPLAWFTFTIVDKTIGLKASTRDERRGLDYTEHYELGYPEFQQTKLHKD